MSDESGISLKTAINILEEKKIPVGKCIDVRTLNGDFKTVTKN